MKISKEYIEHLLAMKYIKPRNFKWEDHNISFDCDGIREDFQEYDCLKMQLIESRKTIDFISGQLNQAERTLTYLLGKTNSSNGEEPTNV